jgi:hypothetical protein
MGKLADRSSKRATRATQIQIAGSIVGSSETETLEQFQTQRSRESFRNPLDRVAGAAIINESIAEVTDLEAQTATSTRDEELREEIEENLSEFQVEQREEVLSESGGSSERTQVLGDEEGEEITTTKNEVLLGFKSNFGTDGFYQALQGIYGSLEDEQIRAKAKQQSNNAVLIGKTSLISAGVALYDYRAISRFNELEVKLATRQILYSDAEKAQMNRIISNKMMNESEALEAVENFLDVSAQQEVEGAITINKIESRKKIKLSSVSEDLPEFQRPTLPEAESTESSSTATQQVRTQAGSVASVPTGVSEEVTRVRGIRVVDTLAPGLRDTFEPPRGTY